MEDLIVDDYKYNNCFWMKSGLLYSHAEKKFQEFISVGNIFSKFSEITRNYYEELNQLPSIYSSPDDEDSTTYLGIKKVLDFIKKIAENLKNLTKKTENLAVVIIEKNDTYQSRKRIMDICERDHKKYQDALTKLKNYKENYFDSINKAIEAYISNKLKGKVKKINQKFINEIEARRKDYKAQIAKIEEIRVEYMNVQGNIFASQEEFERD